MELSSGIKTKCVHTDACRERIMKLMEEDTSNELQQDRIKRRRDQETGDAEAGAAVPDPAPNVEMQSEDVGGEPIDLEDGPVSGSDIRFPKAVRFRDSPGDDSARKRKAGAATPTGYPHPAASAAKRPGDSIEELEHDAHIDADVTIPAVATVAATPVLPTWTLGQAASSSSTATAAVADPTGPAVDMSVSSDAKEEFFLSGGVLPCGDCSW